MNRERAGTLTVTTTLSSTLTITPTLTPTLTLTPSLQGAQLTDTVTREWPSTEIPVWRSGM